MKKILILILVFCLTGCYNYRELNQLAIATGFAVDYKDDNYIVTILISNSKKEGNSEKNEASSVVYEGVGKTIFEAIKDTSMSISKQIYLSHIEILAVSEEVAKNHMLDVTDFFFRYPQTRNQFLMVIASKSMAKDLFLVTTPLETFPSQNIAKNIDITDKLQGYTYSVNFNEFIKLLIEEGSNPTLPTISVIGNVSEGNDDENIKRNEPNTYLKLGMLGIFKGSKLVGIATADQSKGINFLNNKVNTTLVKTECSNGNVVVEINKSKTKIDYTDNTFKVKITSDAAIEEVTCKIDLDNEETIKKLKENTIEEIKRLNIEAINFAKENKTDIFNLGNIIYKKDFKHWYTIKDKWQDDLFLNSNFEFDIKLNLKTKGSIDNIIEVR